MLDASIAPIHILLNLHPDGVGVNYSEHGEVPLLNSESEPSPKSVKMLFLKYFCFLKNQEPNKGKRNCPPHIFFSICKETFIADLSLDQPLFISLYYLPFLF